MAGHLTANAIEVLQSRYLLKDADGRVCETPEELFERVAYAIAAGEGSKRNHWASEFFEMMNELRFLPNSPTLMNAGKKNGQLSACFVLPVEDDLIKIFDSLKYAALIHQSGGGTGFSFSRLRQKGASVKSSHGTASGPVSFMRIFDQATETIKQGGTRRGANMGILRVDHPDIFEFIECKRDLKAITNFNISVAITDVFMLALQAGADFSLKDPRAGATVRTVRAREIWDRLIEGAWSVGDPGVVFLDRINRFNPTPQTGEMESTNPCGEQPLLPFESCNLGSLRLSAYIVGGGSGWNWGLLERDVRTAVRFLDNVIDQNHYPVEQSRKITLKNRKIGLGVMGWADALLEMGIPYDSEDARVQGERVMSFIDRSAKAASRELAKKRGPFANYRSSMWKKLGYPPQRNATVSTVAPTGTISMIAGCSSGIEPIFSSVFARNVLNGRKLIDVHPTLERLVRANGGDGIIARNGAPLSDREIVKALGVRGRAWVRTSGVSVQAHVGMQAVFQRHSDSAVSKTINLPLSATQADVEQAYLMAYKSGCKGITVFRDQSRGGEQVLEDLNRCDECVD